jgi:hypothetical protein
MKKRNKVLLTVGTLVGVYGAYDINWNSLVGEYIQRGVDVTNNVKQTEIDMSAIEAKLKNDIKNVKDITTQRLGEYTFTGEFGCGANHHIEGGCGGNHMPEEKYEELPSEHNPGNKL